MGLSDAWMKFMLHYTFIWKFKGNSGWKLIPEQEQTMTTQEEFSKSEKFWMNSKLYQLWRFIVLNIKIYTVAVQSKWK